MNQRGFKFNGALAAFLVFFASCANETLPALELPAGCNPLLAGADCMLPFPSDFFLVDDETLPSGKRIEITGAAVITNVDEDSANIYEVEAADGFSLTPPILAVLGEPLSGSGLTTILDDPSASLKTAHPTLLIHAQSGELIPHFVDLDPRAKSPQEQALIIRPLVGLQEQTRYIVVLHGVRNDTGAIAQTPEGFRRIRDKLSAEDPALEPLAKHYEQSIFPQLKNLSIKRNTIQLAWDFTTGSIEHVHKEMLESRQLVLEELTRRAPAVEINEVIVHESGDAWKTIHGTITAPLILESDKPGADLFRDEAGRIALNGEAEVPFIAVFPRSLMQATQPASIIQYGHGFFGERSETNARLQLANQTKSVLLGIDWWGLSESDLGEAVGGLSGDMRHALRFSKRLYQAMGNWLALCEALRTTLQQQEQFQREDGQPIYDPTDIDFVGMSLGAILGGTYTALNPSIGKSILHVGGVALAQMMFRSQPFAPFLFVLDMVLPSALAQQKFVATLQSICDRFDPASYAPFLLERSLATPLIEPSQEREVFFQVGLADTHVPNFASFLYGRLAGVPLLDSSPIDVYGLDTAASPHVGSAMTIFDLGEDPSFTLKAEPPGPLNNVHTALRGKDFAIAQMKKFLLDGVIESP